MTLEQLKELGRHAARRTAPTNFEVANVDAAFADELSKLAGNINNFMRNKYDIFEIIIENADEIIPNKVISAIGAFAEVKVVGQGEKALFKVNNLGKNRARKFLTQVGLSGVYESFRLDNATFELSAHAVGGAAFIDFERMLDGADSLADVMEIITEGLTDAVFGEVQRALIAAYSAVGRPNANKVESTTFNANEMAKLVNVVKNYGGAANIYACPEFISAMGPDAIVPGTTAYLGVYHPEDIDAIHKTGLIKIFRGTPIVEIPQSYIDESNTTTWMNPQYAFVLPAGKERIVKVVLEGQTQVWDVVNRDQSIEINAYKKMGCAILTHHNWGIYRNTGIADTSYDPYGFAD